jgi:hypothetical protein
LEILSIRIETLQWVQPIEAPGRKIVEIVRESHIPGEVTKPIPLDFVYICQEVHWICIVGLCGNIVVHLPEDFVGRIDEI